MYDICSDKDNFSDINDIDDDDDGYDDGDVDNEVRLYRIECARKVKKHETCASFSFVEMRVRVIQNVEYRVLHASSCLVSKLERVEVFTYYSMQVRLHTSFQDFH
ncbi:hypothetical protein ElyMa_003632400 [Elysia marginata]|uniref:Uncharacterized protein n=1 Tax=Elysia marginata TaxID=1093978 RepID=A0AAV4EUK4_9GAST|nr:hypothetical protein ElyMa_003632400 [Elysia marginata]